MNPDCSRFLSLNRFSYHIWYIEVIWPTLQSNISIVCSIHILKHSFLCSIPNRSIYSLRVLPKTVKPNVFISLKIAALPCFSFYSPIDWTDLNSTYIGYQPASILPFRRLNFAIAFSRWKLRTMKSFSPFGPFEVGMVILCFALRNYPALLSLPPKRHDWDNVGSRCQCAELFPYSGYEIHSLGKMSDLYNNNIVTRERTLLVDCLLRP